MADAPEDGVLHPRMLSRRAVRELESRFRDRLTALITESAKGQASSSELDEVERLGRVLEISRQMDARRGRTYLVTFCLAAVIFVLVLATIPVRSMEVEGAIQASGVQFILPQTSSLPFDAALHRFDAAGYEAINLPRNPGGRVGPSEEFQQVFAAGSGEEGYVTLQEARLSSSSHVSIRQSEGVNAYHFTTECTKKCKDGWLLLALRGAVRLGDGGPERLVSVNPGQDVQVSLGANRMDFDILLKDTTGVEIFTDLDVVSLSFSEASVVATEESTLHTAISTIEGGELVLVGSNGSRQPLRPRDEIHLYADTFHVQRIMASPKGMMVHFRTHVRRLDLGSGSRKQSLMPSMLRWFVTDESLASARVAILGLIALAAGLLHWKTS